MQILINGLVSGLAIALTATAFQLVYLPTRVLYFGLAGLYALSPYLYAHFSQSMGVVGAASLSAASIMALAFAIEKLNHAPLERKHASGGAHFISSLAIAVVLIQIIAAIWGPGTQTLRPPLEPVYELGAVVITHSQVLTAITALVLLSVFVVMIAGTRVGLHLRALADNPTQFALHGHDVGAYRAGAFALSGLLAWASSLLSAYEFGFDPFDGMSAVLLALVAIIVGGRLSFVGPIIGALLVGLAQAQVAWYFSLRWVEAVTFLVLIAVLLLRPQGLFGRRTRAEASGR